MNNENYANVEDAAFLERFRSIILLTYRAGFPTESLSQKSDAGWGCMLRVIQMMVAACLEQDLEKAERLKYFLDVPGAQFGVPNLCRLGESMGLKATGQWFGPTTSSQVITAAIEAERPCGVRAIAFPEGTIFEDELPGGDMLIFVARKLGASEFNQMYKMSIQECFRIPGFQGLASGNDRTSAHYFVACTNNALLYLDPHIETQPIMDDVSNPGIISQETVRSLPWSKLNASVCLCLRVAQYGWGEMKAKLEQLDELFEILPSRPKFPTPREEVVDDDDDMVLIS